MTPEARAKIKAAIKLLEEALVDEAKADPLQLTTRPELEIVTREAKPPTKKKWVTHLGFFGSSKSGRAAKYFVR